ncbi:MAG TPA: methylated-DNA--[protein]-cysteine S-methyltransferase [Gemmata sp.]|jgi:AraC family transcriptional regulator of adaptative response/methylated-DNA-[protein]-cysteine methyltransferase|nr:methylated-DNA--[protein]-cysteine S-methyltransferase [Gemmata sp.]
MPPSKIAGKTEPPAQLPPTNIVTLIGSLCEFIQSNPDGPPTLAVLGRRVGLSPSHLQRVFKRVVGISPRQFADACRLNRLKTGLKEGETVTTAMFAAGYGSSSRLYEKAAGQLGMTPGQYRKGGVQATIRYTTARCAFGRVILAATDKGVCAISLGDTDADLTAFLEAEFPGAIRQRDDAGLAEWLAELLHRLTGDMPHLELPLDIRATAFQRRVWEELEKIPRGETRTYQQVAAAIGEPTAARAVARACATNPVSVVIPCHRVIGSDGGLRGYRWGLARKKKLLANEKKD